MISLFPRLSFRSKEHWGFNRSQTWDMKGSWRILWIQRNLLIFQRWFFSRIRIGIGIGTRRFILRSGWFWSTIRRRSGDESGIQRGSGSLCWIFLIYRWFVFLICRRCGCGILILLVFDLISSLRMKFRDWILRKWSNVGFEFGLNVLIQCGPTLTEHIDINRNGERRKLRERWRLEFKVERGWERDLILSRRDLRVCQRIWFR